MIDEETVKPFKTYEEQLNIIKSRGMVVNDDDTALSVLRSENYYRLSGYWLSMIRKFKDSNADDAFYEGTTFENLLDLYYFDIDFRAIILNATLTIETNIKAFIAYYHGQKYGPIGYLNSEYFEDIYNHANFLTNLQKEATRKRDEAFVKHHIADKNSVFPVWVATELVSFDQISKFYKNLLTIDRQKIAKEFYGISSREYIESWLHSSVVARNKAAHSARFYNIPYYKPAVKLPEGLKQYSSSLFGYVYAIYNLLPEQKRNVFVADINMALESHKYVLLSRLGLPEQWNELLLRGSKAQEERIKAE